MLDTLFCKIHIKFKAFHGFVCHPEVTPCLRCFFLCPIRLIIGPASLVRLYFDVLSQLW